MGHDVVYPVSIRFGGINVALIPITLILLSIGPFASVYLMSKAFISGLGSARDPEHRLTPQDPWYFFDPYWRGSLRTSITAQFLCGFPVLILLNLLLHSIMGVPGFGFMEMIAIIVFDIGWTFAALSIVLFLAPKYSIPSALCSVGLVGGFVFALLLLSGSMLLLLAMSWNVGNEIPWLAWLDNLPFVGSPFLVCFVTFLTYTAIWRDIRRDPEYAWFRFES